MTVLIHTRIRHDHEGSTSFQFALVAVPLFMMILGIVQTGVVFWSWQAMEAAAIDAGRCAGLNALPCKSPAATPQLTQSYAATAAQVRGLSAVTMANITVLTGATAQARCGNTTANVVSIVISYTVPVVALVPLQPNLTASACFPLAAS